MLSVFINDPTDQQISSGTELASKLGHHKTQHQKFRDFWSRIPISDAADQSPLAWSQPLESSARIFFSSGGSTGNPKYIYSTFSEVLSNSAIHGKGYEACGITQHDVVATWGTPGLMSSEFTVYVALAETGCCILPIGDTSDPASIVRLIKHFGATVILAMPSDMNPVISYLETHDDVLESIRLVVTGGEPLFQVDMKRFSDRLAPGTLFRSVFQTSDTGTIGYQCSACQPNEYHIHDEIHILELVNIGRDGVGELLTTNLIKKMTPIVRQRTGDLARMIRERCTCGRTAPRIEIKGRTGRVIKFGGEKFDLNSLFALKDNLDLPSSDFCIVVEKDLDGRDRFRLMSDRVKKQADLQNFANAAFMRLSPKISKQIERGVVGSLEFDEISHMSLKVAASGKTQFFLDRRVYG